MVEGYGPSILGCATSACSSWHATATLPHPCGPPCFPKLLARHTLVTAACSLYFITIFFPTVQEVLRPGAVREAAGSQGCQEGRRGGGRGALRSSGCHTLHDGCSCGAVVAMRVVTQETAPCGQSCAAVSGAGHHLLPRNLLRSIGVQGPDRIACHR